MRWLLLILALAGCPATDDEMPMCEEGFVLAEDNTCVPICQPEDPLCDLGPCDGQICPQGTFLDESACTCVQINCDEQCANQEPPQGVVTQIAVVEAIPGGGFRCTCQAAECEMGFELVMDFAGFSCVSDCFIQGLCVDPFTGSCILCGPPSCCETALDLNCTPQDCSVCEFSADGVDLRESGQCFEPQAQNRCISCHFSLESSHGDAVVVPDLTCVTCHGGDATERTMERAHPPLPAEWRVGAPTVGRPNQTYYYNWLTRVGAERFEGGLEWLRFQDPGDLRIADRSCGQTDCHAEYVESVRRSTMATAAGLIDGARAATGLPRAYVRGNGIYKLDATVGFTGSEEPLYPTYTSTSSVLAMPELQPFSPVSGHLNQMDVLEDVYAKACAGCHLYSAGRNDRYGDFRGSGCSACHMAFRDDGRSSSNAGGVVRGEPSYPRAYTNISSLDANTVDQPAAFDLPERPHVRTHTMVRVPDDRACGTCHYGSSGIDWQYRGLYIDRNNTVSATTGVTAQLIPDFPVGPDARYRGLRQDQIYSFVDWNEDNIDDAPPDVHRLAGLACVDCHTGAEMHNVRQLVKVDFVSDWNNTAQVEDQSGIINSRSSSEIRCEHCHGTADDRAYGFQVDNRNPVRNLIPCQQLGDEQFVQPRECQTLSPGRWLRLRSDGTIRRVPQVVDGMLLLKPSLYHGRVNQDPNDGVGPCINGDPSRCFKDQATETASIASGFSHLDQVECASCHATWTMRCFGCHVTMDDRGRDFSQLTGEATVGRITQLDVTFTSPSDLTLGLDGQGRVRPFESGGGIQLRWIKPDGADYFGNDYLIGLDPSIRYNAYRHRTGYGLEPYNVGLAGLLPNADSGSFEQRSQMAESSAGSFNPAAPHTIQRISSMACTDCHLDANQSNTDAVAARFGYRSFGGLSPYLNRLNGLTIQRADSGQAVTVDAAAGFRLDGDLDPEGRSVDLQLDHAVSPLGFPYGSTNHPLQVELADPYTRPYPLLVPTAGPIGPDLYQRVLGVVAFPGP